MAIAPTFLTWQGGTGDEGPELPRRPSTDDLGGDAKLDDDDFPPDDLEHPTAAGWNQLVKQVAALSVVAESCKIEVRFSGSDPYLARVASPNGAVVLATFTPTDNGTGDTTIEWPADTFPPFMISPSGLTLLSSSTSVVAGHVEEVTNGIRVRTFVGGVATDVPWTLHLN